MASADGVASPESSASSLLASSGRLRSSLRPEPVRSITYKDRQYESASDALEAYIRDYQRSLRDRETATGRLELPKHTDRNTDVLKASLSDAELAFLNLPLRQRDADGLSVTTDDLLVLPIDGSLPVTHTSALLSRRPLGFRSGSGSRSHHKRSTHRPVPPRSSSAVPVDDLLTARFSSQRQPYLKAPPPSVPSANQTLPPDTPRSNYLPRWMTSQKSEMDFSGMTSVPDLKYPAWLSQCDGSSDRPLIPRIPSWVGELESAGGQPDGHSGEPDRSGSITCLKSSQKLHTEERGRVCEGQLFRDDRIDSLISRAERMINSPSFSLRDVKAHDRSGETEDALDADRSWDNPPVTFKSPVPVGGAEEPEEIHRSQSAASSGYSSRKHPGPVEALKHMLFRLQDVEHKISQSQTSSGHEISQSQAPRVENEISQSQMSSGQEISQSQMSRVVKELSQSHTSRVDNKISQSQTSSGHRISQLRTSRVINEISQSQMSRVGNEISQSQMSRVGNEISQSQTSSEVAATAELERETQEREAEETDTGSGESLRRSERFIT